MNLNLLYLGGTPGSIIMKKKLFNLKDDRVFTNANLQILKNNKFIIIKHFDNNMINNIKKLKQNNNIIIYEPIDYQWNIIKIDEYISKMKIFNYVDKIILPSQHCMKYLQKYINKSKIYYNYHEYDTRFKIDYTKRKDIVNYIGDINKSSFNKQKLDKYNIIQVKSSNNNNLLKNIYNPSIHIDYLLEKNIYFHFHTSTKLATCMNFKSIFICNRIPIYVEILGEKYDLFIKDDLSDLQQVIIKAKNIINNDDLYQIYINKMKKIFNELSPNKIYNNYINIINE